MRRQGYVGYRPSDDAVQEQGYLVARGVRALALLGTCVADPRTMLEISTRLEGLADQAAIPFVLDRGDGLADYGFAGASWVLTLYKSVVVGDALPPQQRSQVLGLLLGYSVDAIRGFSDRGSGRLFKLRTGAPSQAGRVRASRSSRRSPCSTCGTAGRRNRA